MIARTKAGKIRKRVTPGAPVEERLALHTRKKRDGGCWLWTGSKTNGYGRIMLGGKLLFAHRVSYETFVGPILDGLHIDHLCRTPACVNPEHLEPVTPQANTLRGESLGAKALRSGACNRGHARSVWGVDAEVRTYCRLCRLAYLREYNRLRKAGLPKVVDVDAIFRSKRKMASLGLIDIKPGDILDNTPGRILAGHRYGVSTKRTAA